VHFAGAALVLAAVVIADANGWLLVRRVPRDMDAYDGARVRVARVIAGDTLEIDVPDAVRSMRWTEVRLWGVDCPEPAVEDRGAQRVAREAAALAADRTLGAEVTLRLEPQRTRTPRGRLLAHVDLDEGRSLGEVLLATGLARVDDRWPHARLRDYAHAEDGAQRSQCGRWAPVDAPGEAQ
jgi:endonuclease YncB( thermonuclease family)